MSKTKKNLLFMLCFALIMLVAAAFSAFNANKAHAADATADDFKVASIGIRLQDNAAETGVRFGVQINEELLNKADAKVTLYMLPQMFYVSGAHLNAGAATAQSVEIPGTGWAGENGYKTAYAYVYDFPANNYGVKLLAEACLTYTENGATVSKWTAVSDAYSLTDVAKIAQAGGKNGADGYIIDQVKITYKNADGTIIGSETPDYGTTLNYPAAAVIKNKTQRGWITSKNTLWNTSWTAQGNMTLTAAYYDGSVVDDKVFSAKGLIAETVNEAAPDGFEKVWKTNNTLLKSDESKYLHGQYYSAEDITGYSEIRYAVKTDYQFSTPSGICAINGWVYYTFIQNDDGTWNMTMTYTQNGEVKTDPANNISLYTNGGSYTVNSLQALSYNAWYLPYVKNVDTSYVYFTELRGTMKPYGTIIDDKVFSAKGIVAEAVNEAAPGVFEKVWKSNNKLSKSGESKYLHGQFYSAEDITGYSEIRYAVKTDYQFSTPSGICAVNGWVYYTFVQNDDGTWNMTMTYTQNGEVKTDPANNISLYTNGGSYTVNSLQALSYNAWYLPYVKNVDTSYVYFTELRGVKKK